MRDSSINNDKISVKNSMNKNHSASELEIKLGHYNKFFAILDAIDTAEFLAKYTLPPQTDTNVFRP